MTLDAGTRIGSFEVIGPLGAGGMGEVYRATDTRLKREVAIKVLPQDVIRDRERLARFEREAQVLASLNHRNIGSIYGLEDSGDIRCLVLELIEGETLADVIGRGPMALERALGFALQIAEALEAAHERGIVHRDLKPANVKVTPDGIVKVLDFGLAKAYGGDPASGSDDVSLSPTLTLAATQAGVILGTAAYMSPEQASGQTVDARSDVWSFGVVLLEMLTGRKTFGGETVSHTLASVLKEEPDWSRLPENLPARIRELIERCLRKKVRRRLQSIGEARVLLEEFREAPETFVAPAATAQAATETPPRGTRLTPWIIAVVLAVALASAPWWLGPGEQARASRRVQITLPEGEFLFGGYGSSVVVSRDGSMLAYVTTVGEMRRLYVRYLDQWKGTLLVEGPAAQDGPYHPFFSYDGQWVGYVTRTELKKVPIRGGTAIALCPVERNRGSSWGADGGIIFAHSPGSGLSRVPASGGTPEPLTTLDEASNEASHRWPQILPGDKAVLFTSILRTGDSESAKIEVLDLATGERKVIHEGGAYARYVASGHIVYYLRGTLFAFPFDLSALEPSGSVAPVVEVVTGSRGEGGAQFDVGGDGTLVYASGGAAATTTLVWVDRDGGISPLWATPQEYANPALSPDGLRLAVDLEVEGNRDIWVYDLARDVPTRITFDAGRDTHPVWSPDGSMIYYASERDGQRDIYRVPSDGSRGVESVVEDELPMVPSSVSPDGRTLAASVVQGGNWDIWMLPVEGGEPERFTTGPAVEYSAQFSPDGRWIVYGSDESGAFEVYVRPAEGTGGKWQISSEGGLYPRWSRDGRSIVFNGVGAVQLKTADVEIGSDGFRAGRDADLVNGPFDISGDENIRWDVAPGGDRFVMIMRGERQNDTHEHLQVVIGWLDELGRTFDQGGS